MSVGNPKANARMQFCRWVPEVHVCGRDGSKCLDMATLNRYNGGYAAMSLLLFSDICELGIRAPTMAM